jgi:hypothetical protein
MDVKGSTTQELVAVVRLGINPNTSLQANAALTELYTRYKGLRGDCDVARGEVSHSRMTFETRLDACERHIANLTVRLEETKRDHEARVGALEGLVERGVEATPNDMARQVREEPS